MILGICGTQDYFDSPSKVKFVKKDQKIINSQRSKNSPTPKNQKLDQELNIFLAPKPTWEGASPEQ